MNEDTSLATPPPAHLVTLAGRINEEHRACEATLRAGLVHAIRAGELLIEARALVPHGEWLPWLAGNFAGSERTAQGYMRVAREWPAVQDGSPQRVADLSLRGALVALAEPKESADEPTDAEAESVRAAAELVVAIVESWWAVAARTYTTTTGEDAVSLEQWCADVSAESRLPFSVDEAAIRRAAWVAYGSLPIEARPWPDDAAETMRRLGM
jgi:hypothetical protein